MSRIWRREDWNDIIQRVNALSDSGCSGGTPIPEVPANHIWTIDDVETVRNRLIQMCGNSPTFSADLNKWTKTIIDELEEAIESCQCCDPFQDNGITYGPFTLASQPYGADHWTVYYFDPSGYQFGSNGILGRWACVNLYGAQITGYTSLKTTPYDGPYIDCEGHIRMETWSSAQGSSDTSIAPALAAQGVLPIIDVHDWMQNYVWYQPPWTANMYITITIKYVGGNYPAWARCTNNGGGGDYHASMGGTLLGSCPLAWYRPLLHAPGGAGWSGITYPNQWWMSLDVIGRFKTSHREALQNQPVGVYAFVTDPS